MIVYFADRHMNILGQASTNLPEGMAIKDDLKTEDIETGSVIFECKIPYDEKTRDYVESFTAVGNYLLRSYNGENEFYTIIDSESDTKKQTVYIYAEDAGMDLLNEVVGAYESPDAQPISFYIDKYAASAGFVIGVNEVSSLTRKLSWDGEATAAARLVSVANQFDNCEISFSFDIKGLTVQKKYVNIYKKRGKDNGIQLRLNYEIDSIVTSKSIANLATALECTGGTPDNADDPITLSGYSYDDGDIYVDGTVLKSRKALSTWNRYLWKTDKTQRAGGHITKQYSYDTISQATLCAHAVTELKKLREMEINYDVDITRLPDNVKIGDRVNIIDDSGNLYVSTRILTLETSACDNTHRAVLGDYLIKNSGISQKVSDLAAEFAKQAQSVSKKYATKQEVDDTSSEIHTTIIEQNTALSQTCEEIVNQALTSYTEIEAFEEFKTDTTTQMQLISDQTVSKIEEQQSQMTEQNTDLQNQINTITQYFDFSIDGMKIGQTGSPYHVTIDDGLIEMSMNGESLFKAKNGKVYTPDLEASNSFNLLGFMIEKDNAGNVNCEFIGGES